jgi:predicted lipoprotein with Yx(FWY)xxD motif
VLNQMTESNVVQVMSTEAKAPAAAAGPARWPLLACRLTGAGLLAATAAIHLDLYLTGYRSIPTIGWLFLLQVIAAFALAACVLAAALLATGDWVILASGALFALSTLAGYLLSIWVGLFGFTEVETTAGIAAGVIEVAAFAVLATGAVLAVRGQQAVMGRLPGRLAERLRPGRRGAAIAIGLLSVLALILLGNAVAGVGESSPVATSGGAVLKTAKIGGVTVLTNAKGFTLYWFAPDPPGKSVCNGSCAVYWPPVTGRPSAGPGISGRLGTIKRAGGTAQATYNGHPLYTYVGDSAPGQARGNNLNLNGGLWHQIPVSH